ncbi:MAG: VOC family protein [Paludibacteraceae bacterium]|nr:VOC family protein [Paludibacteraceae bacterium]
MLEYLKFHHIGYAVKNIESTARFYIDLGWDMSEIYLDSVQKTYIAFLTREDFPMIELVAPVDEYSPINETLKKMGVTTYHICYEVSNINDSILELRSKRFMPVFMPVEAVAMGGKKICYMMHPQVGLIELVEV